MIQKLKHQVLVVTWFVQTSFDNQQKDRTKSLKWISQLHLTGEITQHTVIHNARISTTIIEVTQKRQDPYILYSYAVYVSQSKATSPNTHDQPINSKVQCRRTYDSANTQTSWARISVARMNLCREFSTKKTVAGRRQELDVFLLEVLQKMWHVAGCLTGN